MSTIEGEATALLESIQMAINKGLERVVLESDSQVLANLIYSSSWFKV